MSAFIEEQQAILREAFHHVWSRMEGLHADLNEATAYTERGLLTDEEMDQLMARLHVEGGHEAQQEPESITEQGITAAILGGCLEAFRRQQAQEEEED